MYGERRTSEIVWDCLVFSVVCFYFLFLIFNFSFFYSGMKVGENSPFSLWHVTISLIACACMNKKLLGNIIMCFEESTAYMI